MEVKINAQQQYLKGSFSRVTGLELTPDMVVLAVGGAVVQLPLPTAGAELQIQVPNGAVISSDAFRFSIGGKLELSAKVTSMGRIEVSATADPSFLISGWSFRLAEYDEMEQEALDEVMQTGRA
jgi:hypothetical protein